MKNTIKVKIYGVNLGKIYKILKKNDVELFNISRPDYKTMYFEIKGKKLGIVKKCIINTSYSLEIIKHNGLFFILDFLRKKLGYVFGAMFFIIAVFCSNIFVSDIQVFGNESISTKDLLFCLETNGIKNGSNIFSIDIEQIKDVLLDKYNQISLISCIKKGNTIIINIKEKQSLDKDSIK